MSIVDLMTDIGDPAFASRYALSLAALAGTLPLAGQRRRGDEDAQDLAIDVASAEAVRHKRSVPGGTSWVVRDERGRTVIHEDLRVAYERLALRQQGMRAEDDVDRVIKESLRAGGRP